MGEVIDSSVEIRKSDLREFTNDLLCGIKRMEEEEYPVYKPIVKYTVDGMDYEIKSEKFYKKGIELGKNVPVLYLKENPG